MSARPIGTMCSPSGTSPLRLYSISPSRTITGLLSRMADLSRPFASAGVAGATTFSPGVWASQLSPACECWGESCSAAPLGPRETDGSGVLAPDTYHHLGGGITLRVAAGQA